MVPQDPISKKPFTKKSDGGVAQDIGPEFKIFEPSVTDFCTR
jgi:hypothetical protein